MFLYNGEKSNDLLPLLGMTMSILNLLEVVSMQINLEHIQKTLDWLKTILFLDGVSLKSKNRIVKRGQVYRCNFGCGIGSEMQKDRPAIIIQNDIGNNRSGNTIVAPITHDISTLPCVATITPQFSSDGKLLLDGQANLSNIMCVSKARLGDLITTLSSFDMHAVDEAIAKTVGLMSYYSELMKKLNDKNTYIIRLKEERNNAQDQLNEIRYLLAISAEDSIISSIMDLKKH